MKGKLLTASVVVLALFSVFNYIQDLSSNQKYEELKQSVDDKTNKVIVYNGKDGVNGTNGVDGINAVSFSITELRIKEVPLVGTPGKDGVDGLNGADGPAQAIRVNPDTKNIENKYTTDKYWITLVECSEYRLECPDAN